MQHEGLAVLFVVSSFVMGCLPGDTRPEPGQVYVTAEASSASTNGFSTDDGWSIRFERLMVGLGNVSLGREGCNEYAGSGYDRLYEFTRPGAQKLGQAYGLGGCDIEFRLRSPSDEALLQEGTTATDREFMRELDSETLALATTLGLDRRLPRTGVYARGTATRGDEVKQFDWKFQMARYELSNCENPEDGTLTSAVDLQGGVTLRRAISFHGEDLFRVGVESADLLGFGAIASADADADGNITLKELADVEPPVPLPDLDMADELQTLPKWSGWAGFMTDMLVPRLVYLDGSMCQVRTDEPGRGGDGPF